MAHRIIYIHSHAISCDSGSCVCNCGEVNHPSLGQPLEKGKWASNYWNVCAGGPALCCTAFICPYMVIFPDAFTKRDDYPGIIHPDKYHHRRSFCCDLTGCQYIYSGIINTSVRKDVMKSNDFETEDSIWFPLEACCCLPCAAVQQRIITAHKVSIMMTSFCYLMQIRSLNCIFVLGLWTRICRCI
jgi:hypothetical protein